MVGIAGKFLWTEQGEQRAGLVATVAVDGPLECNYSFAVPETWRGRIAVGQRVIVPIGKRGRPARGFCLELSEGEWSSTLKPVAEVLDGCSYLSSGLIELGRWISRHDCCPLGRTLAALVPESARRQRGFVSVRYARLVAPLTEVLASADRLGAKQKALLEALSRQSDFAPVNALLAESGANATSLRLLRKRGWVELVTRREAPPTDEASAHRLLEPDFELNADQARAVQRVEKLLEAPHFRVLLLFGVSGSGKTEVYVRAIRRATAAGGQAIFLVPEIALTTQLMNRLAARFADVAVIHSGLTDAQRSLAWHDVAGGRRSVVIGTRSAVFAPCPALKLIVVDEEQEGSYKNLAAPRFNVRDVAIKRAQLDQIPIILGSATPSLETWHNCTRLPHFERIDLPRRVRDLPLPHVQLIQTRDTPRGPAVSSRRDGPRTSCPPLLGPRASSPRVPPASSRLLLSVELQQALSETLARNEQAVLLINRRGHTRSLYCPACKHTLRCDNCQVSLVYHADRRQALCHYCHQQRDAPSVCPDPSCRTPLEALAAGTQHIEEVVQAALPTARIVRADSDTMTHARDYQRLIADFEARTIDILVGTQMIAKGLDFPAVSLVGVLHADGGSHADFRGQERLFQLITQVAGRAGRAGKQGQVIVQTLDPASPALLAAARHDFIAFAESELKLRSFVRFPPFTRLARIILADERPSRVQSEAALLAERIRTIIAESKELTIDVLGPNPCAIERLRRHYRHELLIRAASAPALQRILDHLRDRKLLRARVRSLVIDVDPLDLT